MGSGDKSKSLIPLVLCFRYANGFGHGGGHGIRLIIVLALGLAGLFMMHMLAQDFNKIHGALTKATKLFRSKRDDHNGYYNYNSTYLKDANVTLPEIDWQKILLRDPTECARSLVCQLAAMPESKRGKDENNILTIVQITTTKDNWATRQIKIAYKLGKTKGKHTKEVCYEKYNLCPYSSSTMLMLLRLFGSTIEK